MIFHTHNIGLYQFTINLAKHHRVFVRITFKGVRVGADIYYDNIRDAERYINGIAKVA